MSIEERRQHAIRIAGDILANAEYGWVYEDEDLEQASEEDWLAIHRLILDAKVLVP